MICFGCPERFANFQKSRFTTFKCTIGRIGLLWNRRNQFAQNSTRILYMLRWPKTNALERSIEIVAWIDRWIRSFVRLFVNVQEPERKQELANNQPIV